MIKQYQNKPCAHTIGDMFSAPNIYYTPLVKHHYSVSFTSDIEDPSFYDSVIHLLLTADEDTQVDFLISSYGGRLDSFVALHGAIQQTKATVTGYLMAQSCSAAGMLFLSCHNWVVNEFATFHAHTCSYGSYGKSDDVKQQVDYITAQTERIVRSVYDKILTEEEQNLLLSGKEFYFTDKEIEAKLIAREESRKTKVLEAFVASQEEPLDLSELTEDELEEYLKAAQEDLKDIKAEVVKRKKGSIPEKSSIPDKLSVPKTVK